MVMFDLHVWVWCIIYGKIYRYTYTYYYYIYIYYIYMNNIDILSSYDHIWSRKLIFWLEVFVFWPWPDCSGPNK